MPGVASLPLFRTGTLPSTFGDLEKALDLSFDDEAMKRPGAERGLFSAHFEIDEVERQVSRVSATCAWDVHRDSPCARIDDLRSRGLIAWSVGFVDGWAACEALLRARFGAPGAASDPERSGAIAYATYGPLFVRPFGDDAFAVSWYAKTPDWAVPPADVEEREDVLGALARVLRRASSPREVLSVARAGRGGSGIRARFDVDSCSFELAPAMRAVDLARAFGWADAIGQSRGVHMDTWIVARPVEMPWGRGFEAPTIGVWSVEASLEGWPSGSEVPGLPTGPTGHRHLGDGDLVRSVSIRRKGS